MKTELNNTTVLTLTKLVADLDTELQVYKEALRLACEDIGPWTTPEYYLEKCKGK